MIVRGFEKGLAGGGLATNRPQNTAQKVLQKYVPLLLRGHRKKGTEKRLNLWHSKDFFATTPSCRQPLFETSEIADRHLLSEPKMLQE